MKKSPQLSRRRFIGSATKGLATIPLLSLIDTSAWAAERIEESHPTAVALGYKHDVAEIDASKFPNFKPEQNCTNCVQYTATADGWGTCKIFPGFEVAGPGWCKVWVAKP